METTERGAGRAMEGADDIDLILRHVSRKLPRAVARALVDCDELVEPLEWVDTQVTSRQRRLDRALLVKAGQEKRLLHVEWARTMTRDVSWRIFEYNTLTALALGDEARARRGAKPWEGPPRVESVLVLLSGRDEPWPAEGAYRTSPDDRPFSGVTFRVEPVYQRTVAELVRRATEQRSPLWLIFAPLARDVDGDKLAHVVELLRAQSAPWEFEELRAAMAVLAETNRRVKGLRDVVLSEVSKGVVMQNWFYREGRKDGRKDGRRQGQLEALGHQFERRLGRPLTMPERQRLESRLAKLGAARVGDVVLERTTEELVRWLTPKAPKSEA
ncbi:hypothetical protein [Polyangium spumosum]|uniref:DUF4351 domain-containing protein n=1 Tax=Polyangium spumosum TaxID=889282 RepID=A0A6N7PX65_9BACT|nr:hypothetical protein [Polyangium spumosum]MRG96479.1 hypothetical protein [Polyangium spumosum]